MFCQDKWKLDFHRSGIYGTMQNPSLEPFPIYSFGQCALRSNGSNNNTTEPANRTYLFNPYLKWWEHVPFGHGLGNTRWAKGDLFLSGEVHVEGVWSTDEDPDAQNNPSHFNSFWWDLLTRLLIPKANSPQNHSNDKQMAEPTFWSPWDGVSSTHVWLNFLLD